MIFQETWRLLVDGKKTQTRRIIKGRIGSHAQAYGMDITYYELGPYKLGQRLHVMPARGIKGITKVADIEITRLRHEDARDISNADAHAEGFVHPALFLETWCRINDTEVLDTWREGMSWTRATIGEFMAALRKRPAKFYDCMVIDFKVLKLYDIGIASATMHHFEEQEPFSQLGDAMKKAALAANKLIDVLNAAPADAPTAADDGAR